MSLFNSSKKFDEAFQTVKSKNVAEQQDPIVSSDDWYCIIFSR